MGQGCGLGNLRDGDTLLLHWAPPYPGCTRFHLQGHLLDGALVYASGKEESGGTQFLLCLGARNLDEGPLQCLCHHVSLPNMSIHRQTCLTQQGRERSHTMVSGLVPLNISEMPMKSLFSKLSLDTPETSGHGV